MRLWSWLSARTSNRYDAEDDGEGDAKGGDEDDGEGEEEGWESESPVGDDFEIVSPTSVNSSS